MFTRYAIAQFIAEIVLINKFNVFIQKIPPKHYSTVVEYQHCFLFRSLCATKFSHWFNRGKKILVWSVFSILFWNGLVPILFVWLMSSPSPSKCVWLLCDASVYFQKCNFKDMNSPMQSPLNEYLYTHSFGIWCSYWWWCFSALTNEFRKSAPMT